MANDKVGPSLQHIVCLIYYRVVFLHTTEHAYVNSDCSPHIYPHREKAVGRKVYCKEIIFGFSVYIRISA